MRRSRDARGKTGLPTRGRPAEQLPQGVLAIDVEATGLNRDGRDEILQLAACDSDGHSFSRMYRPEHHLSWKAAERIHHISPRDVYDKPRITSPKASQELSDLFRGARLLVGWNIIADMQMIEAVGPMMEDFPCNDVMYDYAYWEASVTGRPPRRCKLSEAALAFGIRFSAHDAEEDARVTMAIRKGLMQRGWVPTISSYERLAAARASKEVPSRERICA